MMIDDGEYGAMMKSTRDARQAADGCGRAMASGRGQSAGSPAPHLSARGTRSTLSLHLLATTEA